MLNMVGKKGRSGRPRKYDDEFHRVTRERQLIYMKKNRRAILLGKRLKISVAEARKRLGIKFEPKKTHGKVKKE